MKDRKAKKIILKVLLIIIGILYILFLYMDIFNIRVFIPSNIFKYISIILCFLITLLIGKNHLNQKDKILLQAGFFVTILADLCFLILDYYILGITFFCLVQIIYYNRYKRNRRYKATLINVRLLIIFLLIMVIYRILNLFIIKIDFIFAIALFYSICIIISVAESIRVFKNNLYPYPNKSMILWGMILFLLCDLNIAISYMTRGFFMSLHNFSNLLIWVFYLPSQVLLSVSGYKFK